MINKVDVFIAKLINLNSKLYMQVAALLTMIATVYMRVFLEESLPYQVDRNLKQPILIKASTDDQEPDDQDITVSIIDDQEDHRDGQTPTKKTMQVSKKKFPSLQDLHSLLTTRYFFYFDLYMKPPIYTYIFHVYMYALASF